MKWSTIIEGESELSSRRRIDVAGRDLTLYLQKLLYARGYSFTTTGIAIVSRPTFRLGLTQQIYEHVYSSCIQYFESCRSDQEKIAACWLRSSVHKSCATAKKKKKKMSENTLVSCSSFWSRGYILLASQWTWHELMVWRSQYYRYNKRHMGPPRLPEQQWL